jgi:tryptophan synthase beta chain
VLHGNRTYLLQNEDGQILEGHSVSAGLDYPGVGPEHSWLQRQRPRRLCADPRRRGAGSFPAPAPHRRHHPGARIGHAIAHAVKIAPGMGKDKIIIVNLSGRGDKDVHTVGKMIGMEM